MSGSDTGKMKGVVWHTLVMKSNNSDTIEIRSSPRTMNVYVNGEMKNLPSINGYKLKGPNRICTLLDLRYDKNQQCAVFIFVFI